VTRERDNTGGETRSVAEVQCRDGRYSVGGCGGAARGGERSTGGCRGAACGPGASRSNGYEYEERLGHFFSANEITEEAKKRSILLSACGAEAYKLIRNLATPRKPGDIPYDELVSLVAIHHNPKPSVIVQQFKFHSHFRKQGQSVANFVAELRQLSEHCDFGIVLDDMLHDRLVCGISNDAIQHRLLGETPPLTSN